MYGFETDSSGGGYPFGIDMIANLFRQMTMSTNIA